ncbi:class I SAM-dependent methyltransferase [Nitrococcus mobilis]|uniref:3-demethylubiquinone-9 3-methyltransferase, putative n=1 Tax=Nitrococcus mobilis Nb-231 TaxID=314278 RepID=A4BT69_9GAMM|nr:class I SAM-dependent methyltransferase [Nitrococcus mobilis]EAR21137.1 3-demethylubiquinone-9 3-methyltransferase, putative [Nitrococcus mobilis Nb-231]
MPQEVPNEFELRWRSRFERFGESYDSDALIAGWSASGLATRLRAFEALLGTTDGEWLDAGCGAGTYVRALYRQGAERVYGLDYSVPSLKKAKHMTPGSTLAWLAGDVRRLPFRSAVFGSVLCFGVTQALAGCEALIGELVRVTRPAGEIWIDGLNRGCLLHAGEALIGRVRQQPLRVRYESAARLRHLLLAAGCTQARIHWVPIFPQRFQRLQRLSEWMRLGRMPGFARVLSHAFLIRARKPC